MNVMTAKLAGLWPEIALLVGATVCLFTGLARGQGVRRASAWVAGAALAVAGLLAWLQRDDPGMLAGFPLVAMSAYVKLAVAGIGLLLLLLAASVPDRLHETVESDRDAAAGRFDPALSMRGEFFAFFLLSLTGVMLCAGANDLVWLFLALELTSLPTYVMVSTARNRVEAQESGVKYFFLGAMAAAVFLYGFALIYGATGTTQLYPTGELVGAGYIAQPNIAGYAQATLAAGESLPPLLVTGVVLAVLGIAFKIAAFPMHFYAADVYQGAATPVTAFLAFVPKTAGFVAIILLLGLVTAPADAPAALPPTLAALLWVMAAVTMTWGNVLGLLQSNVKRVLAYSSIAHSGYMLVGLIAGAHVASGGGVTTLGSGTAAVLFYLVAYGLSTIAAFAVLACIEGRGGAALEYDDLAGLSRRHPWLAAIMLIAMLSLIGLPPMVGFLGKIYLFGTAIERGFLPLVIIAVLNSAISAVYYLRIAGACYFGEPEHRPRAARAPARFATAAIAAALSVALGIVGGALVEAAGRAAPARAELRARPARAEAAAAREADRAEEESRPSPMKDPLGVARAAP